MKPDALILRCYARQRDGVWIAMCIDLTLAAQGSSFEEAVARLREQIRDYVQEAMTVDREHAAGLLSRKAPLWERIYWHWLVFAGGCLRSFRSTRPFNETLPVVPAAS